VRRLHRSQEFAPVVVIILPGRHPAGRPGAINRHSYGSIVPGTIVGTARCSDSATAMYICMGIAPWRADIPGRKEEFGRGPIGSDRPVMKREGTAELRIAQPIRQRAKLSLYSICLLAGCTSGRGSMLFHAIASASLVVRGIADAAPRIRPRDDR
jgi:hypothetical protein